MNISTSVDIQATTISLLLVMMMNFIAKRTNNRRLALVVFGGLAMLLIRLFIVIRGDWLWKAANINDKNNSAAVYVQSTVKVHNPLFSVGKLLRNKLMQRFYWSIQSKW